MKKTLLLLVFAALQACALPQPLPPATDLKAGASEVVVIGKIELVPPINPEVEQRRYWNVLGEERMLTHLLMATGGENKPIKSPEFDGADFQRALEVEWGVPFAVKAPRERTFLNGGVTYLDVRYQERLWFPGGYYFDVPSGAKAVYIGTLRYHRNDFNRITKVEVVDERRDIAAAVKAAGGSVPQVQASLLKKAR